MAFLPSFLSTGTPWYTCSVTEQTQGGSTRQTGTQIWMVSNSWRLRTGIQFPFGGALAPARKLGHSTLVALWQLQINVNGSGVNSGAGGDSQPLSTVASNCKSCGIFRPPTGINSTWGVQGAGVYAGSRSASTATCASFMAVS